MVATRGMLSAYRIVRHPIFADAHIARENALQYVKPVSTEMQLQMDEERVLLSLSLEEGAPLNDDDRAKMAETIEQMKDP